MVRPDLEDLILKRTAHSNCLRLRRRWRQLHSWLQERMWRLFASRASGRGGRLNAIDDMMAQAIEREFQTIGNAEFVIDFAQIILYYLFGGSYANGNFFVLHALRDARNDQRFLGRELNFRARSRGPQVVAAKGFHDPMNRLVLEPGFAGGDFAQAVDQYLRFHFAR